ncbi:MAG: PIG-L family deacetylase [Clostridia bacterium]|nr:PIG-L family deacetylase [Clostridia bacterium]
MKRILLLLAALCALLMTACAQAEPARNITDPATITVSRMKSKLFQLFDGDRTTKWEDQYPKAYLEFASPEPCYGLYVESSHSMEGVVVQAVVNNTWTTVVDPAFHWNNQYYALPGLTNFRLYSPDRGMHLLEVRMYSEGEVDPTLPRFESTAEKADMLVIACHPDDDILWFGGLLPTYGGELQMNVQVVYMTARYSYRKCEALDALWHCGLRYGPVFAPYVDDPRLKVNETLEKWGGRQNVIHYIARLIRTYQPEVVVTQDEKGEYGHAQHRAMTACVTAAVQEAADAGNKALSKLPAWEVKKYYIHLYGDDPLAMDWERPLSRFGGKTALEIAREAFLKHASQQNGRYSVEVSGPLDSRLFGLKYSAVGEDENKNGFFEHIPGLYEKELSLNQQPVPQQEAQDDAA